MLTHGGRVIHICVNKLTIIGSDDGLSPDAWLAPSHYLNQCWNIGPLGTNFSEISFEIDTFSFKKIHLKISSGKWRPNCLGLNVLTHLPLVPHIASVNWAALVQVMACRLFSAKPLTGPLGTNFSEIQIKMQDFSFMLIHFKMLSANGGHFVQGRDELSTE